MNSIMNIVKMKVLGPDPVEMEKALEECREKGVYDYEWGRVEVSAKPYKGYDGLYEVTVKARAKNGKTVVYRFIEGEHSCRSAGYDDIVRTASAGGL